ATALDRHDPREPARRHLAAEVDLHVAGRTGWQLPLRRMQQQRRHPETKLSMQRVPAAAREHTRARVEQWLTGGLNRHAVCRRCDAIDARATNELSARAHGFVGQASIEECAVYDHGLDDASPVDDVLS